MVIAEVRLAIGLPYSDFLQDPNCSKSSKKFMIKSTKKLTCIEFWDSFKAILDIIPKLFTKRTISWFEGFKNSDGNVVPVLISTYTTLCIKSN